jgi:hypothetical protein
MGFFPALEIQHLLASNNAEFYEGYLIWTATFELPNQRKMWWEDE